MNASKSIYEIIKIWTKSKVSSEWNTHIAVFWVKKCVVILKVGTTVLEKITFEDEDIFVWNTVTHLWDQNMTTDHRRPQYTEFWNSFPSLETVLLII
jgi:hypothetical protein